MSHLRYQDRQTRLPARRVQGGSRRWQLLLALLCAVWLTACASGFPHLPERTHSTHLPTPADSPLAKVYHPPQTDTPLDRVTLLSDPTQALATRMLLTRSAQRSLDIQVYIWKPDASGMVMLHELWHAAERGVRVRLLLDDNGSEGMDTWLLALDAHPGIEVRLFNPFRQRTFKALGYLTDFDRLNRRMHNKSFTADSIATIVGGRNVGDEYYGVDSAVKFSDLDLLAFGPAAQTTASLFDAYWNSAPAYPLEALFPSADPETLAQHRQQWADLGPDTEAAHLQARLEQTPWLVSPLTTYPRMQWAPVQVMADAPEKVSPDAHVARPTRLMFTSLNAMLGHARHSLDLVSPYFVPGKEGTQGLIDLARNGVAIRIFTNSLAATDVMAVHAGYARYRSALLAAGIELYELKPDAASPQSRLTWHARLGSASAASLHGKTFVVDEKELFVGSFNLDPRSTQTNTEMGLQVNSPELARDLTDGINRELKATTYRLQLSPSAELQWLETTADGETIHTREPKAHWLRRVGARILSWLPIEGLL